MDAVSGNANNTVNVGAFYVNANNGSTNRNTNIGRQLSYCNRSLTMLLVPLGVLASWQNTKQISLRLVAKANTARCNSRDMLEQRNNIKERN